jgi:hypothetical protein
MENHTQNGAKTDQKENNESSEGSSREVLQVSIRSGDLEAMQRHARNTRPPMNPGDLLKGHLYRSLLERIKTGAYSPRQLILKVGQEESSGKEVGPSREREKCTVGMDDPSPVERASNRVNIDLLLWIDEVTEKGSVLPAPLRRCTVETVLRAAGREIVAREKVFSRGAKHLASDLRPGPDT